MSPAVAVEVIIGVFFLIGVAVGVIAVIALSALKKDGEPGEGGPDGTPAAPYDAPEGPADERPRWPDSAGDGFYRR